ncbi:MULTISPECIES: DUF3786 domain-containing protein [Desulfobacula]|uniref:Fe-S cluster protein, related to acetyl-CoA synthase n=2 Tax=Desulfobacula TaxID=28222 RepID=K0NKA5_DESTT|nr:MULTISPECIES: DUF3786 domain-containing protein [Desulfobacula]CCK79222.1 Fe-S cluster protein, related to acetyl-CoA synthase [Desulfobacula toluolica Tol2]SDU04130.1 Putative Fe-S cluster [Desulfobacula phenolica]
MSEFANAMEVFKILDKSNCRKCNEQTCLAFASKVFLGEKSLDQCPVLSQKVLEQYQGKQKKKMTNEEYRSTLVADLKTQINSCDLEKAAKRVGGSFSKGKLMIRIFGKQFFIDSQGNMFSDIHINPWIASTVLGYVLHCKGVSLTGKWVPLREIEGGREKNPLFVQRSEKPLKQIADKYPHLFEDLIVLFNGKTVENYYASDISLVLYPLPKLPILICYWKAEDGMESDLHIFFDSSAGMNANVDIVYGIATGIVVMFEKISMKHGVVAS